MKQATTPEECVLERLSLPHCACDLVCDLTPFWLMQLKLNQWKKKMYLPQSTCCLHETQLSLKVIRLTREWR